jgi:CPA2 family monovalent cation:H+ antiporter-2
VAILRGDQLIANPKSATIFQEGDRVGIIGDEEEIKAAEDFINSSGASDQEAWSGIYD